MRTIHAVASAAALLLALRSDAHAREPLDQTTVGIEWEIVNGWAVGVRSESQLIASIYDSKAILCTATTVDGLDGARFPLVALTYDLVNPKVPNQAAFETVTGPLPISQDVNSQEVKLWEEANLALFNVARAMDSFFVDCPPEGCFVPASELMDKLNKLDAGHPWQPCSYKGKNGLGANWKHVGFFVANLSTKAITSNLGVATNTQVNIKIDLGAITDKRFKGLYDGVPAAAKVAGWMLYITGRLSGHDPGGLGPDELDELRGFLAWYFLSFNVHEHFNDSERWRLKGQFYIFPKAPLHQIFALLTPATRDAVRSFLTKEKPICALDACPRLEKIDPAEVLSRDVLGIEQVTNVIKPVREQGRIVFVIETRDTDLSLAEPFKLDPKSGALFHPIMDKASRYLENTMQALAGIISTMS